MISTDFIQINLFWVMFSVFEQKSVI